MDVKLDKLDVAWNLHKILNSHWYAGVVMCLGQCADLHMAQLMPLPLTVSFSSKSRLVLPFWCQLIRVIQPESKRAVKRLCLCMWYEC